MRSSGVGFFLGGGFCAFAWLAGSYGHGAGTGAVWIARPVSAEKDLGKATPTKFRELYRKSADQYSLCARLFSVRRTAIVCRYRACRVYLSSVFVGFLDGFGGFMACWIIVNASYNRLLQPLPARAQEKWYPAHRSFRLMAARACRCCRRPSALG